MEIPARIHILLARDNPQALVIRRGPSKQTSVIGWNRENDCFTMGQWLKGKLYHFRSDISPNGQHWVYFAMGARGQTWTDIDGNRILWAEKGRVMAGRVTRQGLDHTIELYDTNPLTFTEIIAPE